MRVAKTFTPKIGAHCLDVAEDPFELLRILHNQNRAWCAAKAASETSLACACGAGRNIFVRDASALAHDNATPKPRKMQALFLWQPQSRAKCLSVAVPALSLFSSERPIFKTSS